MSWNIDRSHSQITFSVRHMMISNVHGRFEEFAGTVDFNEQDPSLSTVSVEIDAASINTREPQRDTHLTSPDFLNAAEFPKLTFRSTRVELVGDSHARLHGDLTIRGLSRPVTLDVEYAGTAKSPWGTTSAGFSASTRINRKDWDLNWNVALETGGILVGDTININIELEIVKQPESETQTA